MNSSEPVISVIMATHNREAVLLRSVESILNQSFKDFELIITDDASRDNTPAVLTELKKSDNRIQYQRSEKNVGPGVARNMAMERARGKYIAVMDDDDICKPERLEIEKNILDGNPDIDLVFSSVYWINENNEVTRISPGIVSNGQFPENPDEVFALLHLEGSKIPNPTVMARRKIMTAFKYPSSPWGPEDRFMYLQMAAKGVKMKAIAEPLVTQRRETTNVSLMNQKAVAFKAQRIIHHMTVSWLKQNGIHRFDHLHHLAFSNQLIREARYWQGLKGLLLSLYAVTRSPSNKPAYQTVFWFLKKAIKKIGLR